MGGAVWAFYTEEGGWLGTQVQQIAAGSDGGWMPTALQTWWWWRCTVVTIP